MSYWWLRSPLPRGTGMLRHRTFQTIWESPMWGTPADRGLAVLLLASAFIGVCVFNQCQRRVAARLWGLGALSLGVLAVLGIAWEPLGRVGTSGLLVPALWFAALPAAHAWVQGCRLAHAADSRPMARRGSGCAVLLATAGLFARDTVTTLGERCAGAAPLLIGLGPERQALVDTLVQHTGPEARILWEERPTSREASHWTALLPLLTKRDFIGGLDPDAFIEHTRAGLVDQTLEGDSHRQGRRREAKGLLRALQRRLGGVLVAGGGRALPGLGRRRPRWRRSPIRGPAACSGSGGSPPGWR